jgi:osmotically-inducible protein OsmY
MEPSEDRAKDELAQEPFPPTDTTLREPGPRAGLDDRRLGDREVGSSLRDQEIAGNALFALAEDGRVDLGDGLDHRMTIKIEGRIATLSGVVDTVEQRMAAEELVESIPGVELVQNALTVSVDGYLDDGDLDRQVRERLDALGLASVGSRVSHGVARLVGTVGRLADEERAVRVAAGVRGLRDVLSNLKVKTPEYTDDLDLKSLVGQALALNDLVILDRQIRVSNGIVEIAGRVKSLADCRRIRRLIGEINGIRGIKPHIQVNRTLFRDFHARTHLSTGR